MVTKQMENACVGDHPRVLIFQKYQRFYCQAGPNPDALIHTDGIFN
jgi:hypothetical protein